MVKPVFLMQRQGQTFYMLFHILQHIVYICVDTCVVITGYNSHQQRNWQSLLCPQEMSQRCAFSDAIQWGPDVRQPSMVEPVLGLEVKHNA